MTMQTSSSILAIISWTLFALGVCLIVSRITFRLITLGSIFKLQADDWLMMSVLASLTGTVACANQVSLYWNPLSYDMRDLIWMAKMRFALEEFQIATIWLVKACLLILYWRIFPVTTSRKERRYLACVSAYCLFSYLAIQVLMTFWCRPVHDYWDPSSEDPQCSTYRNHSFTTLSFDLTTTLTVLMFPVPYIPTPRRFLLSVLFVLGIFTLIAGTLGRYYIIASPTSPTYLFWHVAEATIIILFANLPFLSSLVASTARPHIRRLSSNLSLSQWPRSYKDTPPLRAQRLDSTATTMSMISPLDESTEFWTNSSATPVTPPTTPVMKLRLTDPPPELEVYWSMRRPSTRDTDMERMFTGSTRL